jgi:hypothetical protein
MDIAVSAAAPPPPVRRFLRWIWLFLAVLALAGVLYLVLPHPYRVVGRYVCADRPWLTNDDGIILRSAPDRFTLYDWHGRRQWSIRPPAVTLPPPPGVNAVRFRQRGFDLTCSQHDVAAAARTADGIEVARWRNGREIMRRRYRHLLPRQSHLRLWILSARTLLLCEEGTDRSAAVVIHDGHVTARGTLPSYFVFVDGSRYAIYPYAGSFRYARLQIRGGTVRMAPCYTAVDPITFQTEIYGTSASTFNDGMVIADNSAVYGKHGRVTILKGWTHDNGYGGGESALLYQGRKVRIYCPRTGADQWRFTCSGDANGGFITGDGAHAIFFHYPALHGRIYDLMQQLPLLSRVAETLQLNYVSCYARPGWKRAQVRMDFDRWWLPPGTAGDTGEFAASGDGHAIAVLLWQAIAPGKDRYQIVLLRW